MKNTLLFCLFSSLVLSAHADPLPIILTPEDAPIIRNTDTEVKCEIILATDSVPIDDAIVSFAVPAEGPSHGGTMNSFKIGNHQIDVSADSHWMVLAWYKDGKLVAQSLFAEAPTTINPHRVIIMQNPDGLGEQVSLGCLQNVPE